MTFTANNMHTFMLLESEETFYVQVKCYKETDIYQKLENLCSLQKTIQLNFGNITPELVSLIEEVGSLISVFLHTLKMFN